MHPSALGYDPADAPIPTIMLGALRDLVRHTSYHFAAKHGPFTERELRVLVRSYENCSPMPERMLSSLRRWYMVERLKTPVSEYKRRKKSTDRVTKREILKAIRTLRRYFSTHHNCPEKSVVVMVRSEGHAVPDLIL